MYLQLNNISKKLIIPHPSLIGVASAIRKKKLINEIMLSTKLNNIGTRINTNTTKTALTADALSHKSSSLSNTYATSKTSGQEKIIEAE